MKRKGTAITGPLPLCVLAAALLLLAQSGTAAAEQQFFRMGDFGLEGGGVIRDCVLGYRTFGKLNGSGSNAVVFPTWFMGTSADLEALIGPGKLVDPSRYFVIAVDAFGNGVSSSPSNSTTQRGVLFPDITIGDMVHAQYRLVTEKLGIKRLHAVIGISMGGMQAFQWLAAYPGSIDKAVPITGTPRPTSYDLLLYRTGLAVLDGRQAREVWDDRALAVAAGVFAMASVTPEHFIANQDRSGLSLYLEKAEKDMKEHDPVDIACQLKAMINHDVYATPGNSARGAWKITTQTFTVVSARDLMVNPQPAKELVRLLGGRSLVLDSDCGHYILQCEGARIMTAVSGFLDE
jgi:homoserine O-acetyltransferase